jgi:hypothetical protein
MTELHYHIYVDDLFTATPRTTQARSHGNRWCHLFTDSLDLEELHQFAEKLGLQRAWFQQHPTLPHYDLVPSKRTLAIKYGAKAVTGEEMKTVVMHEVDARLKQKTPKQPSEVPVFGSQRWIDRSRQKRAPGRCVIEVNGKRI